MRRLAAAWLAAGIATAPAAAQDAPRDWAVRLPSIERVVFRGVVNFDGAGVGTGQFLYPAPNAAGLLAAILTHGLLTEGAKKAQKDKLQSEADEVLQPYAPVLTSFTHDRLVRGALPRLRLAGQRRPLGAAEPRGEDWLLEVAPIFSMTRDQRALVLDNVVRLYAPATSDAASTRTIRVVSRPLAVPVPDDAFASSAAVAPLWMADEGRRLVDESMALFAESLDVAIAQSAVRDPSADVPHKTFRYPEGGTEKMERGQLVAEHCGRVLIRTLRGALLSVPAGAEPAAPECAAPPQRP